MTHHRRHQPHRHTWRLVLAKLCLDRHAEQLIADEVNGCADCWRDIADELAGVVFTDLIGLIGVPGLHPGGLVDGPAVDEAAHRIACALRAAALDARYLDDDEAA
jgi:hypothetical protein